MFTKDEAQLRFQHAEVVEDKERLRWQLEAQTIAFMARGGKPVEVPPGVGAVPAGLQAPKSNNSDSGYLGITWSTEQNKWAVRSLDNRKHLGFAASLCEALGMQEKYKNSKSKREEN